MSKIPRTDEPKGGEIMTKGRKGGDSEKVIIEIDIDDNTITIVPQEGGIYIYQKDEVENDVVDRLLAHADFTVYSQGEHYTVEEMEDLGLGIWGEKNDQEEDDRWAFRWQ